jgi:NADPH-dependent glutamate synthase beta subunit-like oxidoreductase
VVFRRIDPARVALPLDAFGEREVSGKRVVVVGGGQNAMESALRASRGGAASVDVVVRSSVRWFAEREPYQERNRLQAFVYRLAYPITGFGPPPINRLVLHPEVFSLLPVAFRQQLNDRLLRSGGSPWLRRQLDEAVAFHEQAEVRRVEQAADGLRLHVGDDRMLEADLVIIACGFRFDLARMSYLDESIRARIATHRNTGWPVLSAGLRSTAPGLYFAGYPAEGQFGPIVRFIEGVRFTAERCSSAIRQRATAPRPVRAAAMLSQGYTRSLGD